jgi:hypothetical protein
MENSETKKSNWFSEKPKQNFIIFTESYEPIRGLTLAQKGELLDAFFRFHLGEEVSFSDPVSEMAFAFFRQQFQRTADAYEDKCKKMQENGKLGGRPKKQKVDSDEDESKKTKSFSGNQKVFSETKKSLPDPDPDPDPDFLDPSTKSLDQEKSISNYLSCASPPPSAASDAPLADKNSFLPEQKDEEKRAEQSPRKVRAPTSPPDGPHYLTAKKRHLTGKRLENFERFWTAFDYRKGKAHAADAWLDIPELTNGLVLQIIAAAEREAAARPDIAAAGRVPIYPQGWISGRRWEDEPESAAPARTFDDYLREKGVLQ